MYIFDTNVLISALFFSGNEAVALDIVLKNSQLIFSGETSEEFLEVAMRPKFSKYASQEERYVAAQTILTRSRMFVSKTIHTLCRDPKDDKFLDVLLSSPEHILVTGDRDLLVLHEIHNFSIISVKVFLSKFAHAKK